MKTLLLLAETDLLTGLGKVVGLIQAVSVVIMVASLVVAGVSVASGRLEYTKYAILGCMICVFAYAIVSLLFRMIGIDVPVEPQSVL